MLILLPIQAAEQSKAWSASLAELRIVLDLAYTGRADLSPMWGALKLSPQSQRETTPGRNLSIWTKEVFYQL